MQLTLDGRSPIDISIAILREFEPEEGYYLAFSGGKDSVALKHLCDLAGVRYDAHYSMTTVDPPRRSRGSFGASSRTWSGRCPTSPSGG